MIGLAIVGAIGLGALYLWHKVHSASSQPPLPIYYGAPVWPAMNPVAVPDIGLPPGLEQAATYYGVSNTLLEPYLK